MDTTSIERLDLFGGSKPWSPTDWTDSDDRVRGGSSQSYLEANAFEPVAHFYGKLDFETLGGAGFASQRTTAEESTWDLHEWDGIALDIVGSRSDTKKYTLILKDKLLAPSAETGRDQATISWEYDFSLESKSKEAEASPSVDTTIFVPFEKLAPTYRGKPVKDAGALGSGSVKRFSIMNRSFFATQSGNFSLYIRSISAYRKKRSRLESFMQSKAGPPVVLALGTLILFKSLTWSIDIFSRAR